MKETTDDSDHLRVDREEQYTNWNEQTHSSRRNDVTTGRPDRDGPPQGQTSSPRRGQRRAPKLRGRYPMTSEGTCVNPTSGVLTTRLAKKKGEKLRVGECLLRQRPASCRGFKGAPSRGDSPACAPDFRSQPDPEGPARARCWGTLRPTQGLGAMAVPQEENRPRNVTPYHPRMGA